MSGPHTEGWDGSEGTLQYHIEVLDRRPDGEDHEIVTMRLPVRHTDLSGIPQPEVVRHDSSLVAFLGPEPLSPEEQTHEPLSLDELAERMARAGHVIYNRMAAVNGWAIQESTRVDFDDLPEANRRTMIATEKARLEAGVNLPGPAVLAGIEEAK